jgi:hypothetical protein
LEIASTGAATPVIGSNVYFNIGFWEFSVTA